MPVGSHPFNVAIAPNGAIAYITNAGANSVTVIKNPEMASGPGCFHFWILSMNNSYFSMRYLATVALLLFGSMSVAPAIPPAFIGGRGNVLNRTSIYGEVSHVDQNARTFTVHGQRTIRNHSAREVNGGCGYSWSGLFTSDVYPIIAIGLNRFAVCSGTRFR